MDDQIQGQDEGLFEGQKAIDLQINQEPPSPDETPSMVVSQSTSKYDATSNYEEPALQITWNKDGPVLHLHQEMMDNPNSHKEYLQRGSESKS